MMTEDYLHYIYKHSLYSQQDLQTVGGDSIQIISKGNHNQNAGPDFLEARVKIGDKMWAGHVEIHVRSSDWMKHNHQHDLAYGNVILHVVYEDDVPVLRTNNEPIPTLELKDRFDEMGYWRYEQFVSNKRFMACENQLKDVDDIHKQSMLERVLVERLEEKAAFVDTVFQATGNDWNETFYRMLCYAFGLKVNAEAMLALTSRLPLSILRKHTGNQKQIEALLFGTAGLLADEDEYAQSLNHEFEFLQKKYGINPLEPKQFRFSRLRPHGFPTIRLAQLSTIFNLHTDLFAQCVKGGSAAEIKKLLQLNPDEYWETHFRFGKSSKPISKKPSDALVDLVLINAIVPTVFAYASKTSKMELRQQALEWLSQLKPEKNNVIQSLRKAGFNLPSAHETQAGLQLHKHYCGQRKCLNCAIGVKLLSNE